MSTDFNEVIKSLIDAVKRHAANDCVSVNIFINCEGYEISYKRRPIDNLKKRSVSMRSVRGDFIKD